MMDDYLISLLITIPLVAALALLTIPSKWSGSYRTVALAASILQVFVLLRVVQVYQPASEGIQLLEAKPWITVTLGDWGMLQAEYLIGLDGLSLPLVALAVLVLGIAVVASWHVTQQPRGYFVLLLILNASVIGSFAALDMLLFYLFFEFMLLPMYFLIGIWGGPRREYASIKFFLYTLLGSILILIVIIGLYLSSRVQTDGTVIHTFSLLELWEPGSLEPGSILHPDNPWTLTGYSGRYWAFLLLLVGFAIKLPAVPLHTWLPDAHVEASTPISVILAALLLKIGAYGLLRMAYPLFPDAAVHFSALVAGIGALSIVYGALNALAAKDVKRLIAYSSVSHMGFVLLGLAAATTEAIQGALFQLTSHGLISALLFLIAGVLYDRTHDRHISNYSGLAAKMPFYTGIVLVAFLATMGLPGFSGFIGEVMVFMGAFRSQVVPVWITGVAITGLILSAAYCLWLIQRMFFGAFAQKAEGSLYDMTWRERGMCLLLAVLIFVLGIFPQTLINYLASFANGVAAYLQLFVQPQ